jgi:hypothetical protein
MKINLPASNWRLIPENPFDRPSFTIEAVLYATR